MINYITINSKEILVEEVFGMNYLFTRHLIPINCQKKLELAKILQIFSLIFSNFPLTSYFLQD